MFFLSVLIGVAITSLMAVALIALSSRRQQGRWGAPAPQAA